MESATAVESSLDAPPEIRVGETVVRLLRRDITLLAVDAFVFYAQPDLALGSGFGGAISVRGGPSIQKELKETAAGGTLAVGEAVVTGGGKLPARFIIHAVGPRFQEPETEEKLARTMERCLELARERGWERVAFPLMGAGYYGAPPALSARVTLTAIGSHVRAPSTLREILVCVLDTPQYTAFQAAMDAWTRSGGRP